MDKTLGRSGLNHYNGVVHEEFLHELSGKRGVKIYREMADNDDICGAILFAIKTLIRQVDWHVQPGGTDKIDLDAAQFVESCLNDMQQTWSETVGEILSFLTYGWSLFELVYKRRAGNKKNPLLESKYSDGLIGWQKLALRGQETLYEWQFDSDDNLIGFVQMPPPDYELIKIPAEKFLLFRTESRKDNPEGRSILRNAYRSWYFKKRIQELEGIGLERDLAGLPVLTAPDGVDIWSERNAALLKTCNDFVSNIRRDAAEGLVLPAGWKLELLSTGGRRQFDTTGIIQRYDSRIAATVLADFILLGTDKVGSFALSSDKTRLFAVAIGTYLDVIAQVMNRFAIPRLLNLNKKFSNAALPELCHGDIESDLENLSAFLEKMCKSGIITPDSALEDFIRDVANLPPRQD